jgi:hypothetical protein
MEKQVLSFLLIVILLLLIKYEPTITFVKESKVYVLFYNTENGRGRIVLW